MSTESKKYRSEMRAKANRLANMKSPGKIDASSWTPSEPLNADRKTGARPLRARIYKAGGRVQGDRGPRNAGKEPRANGGALSMTNVPEENKKAKGSFHEGGYRKGGKAETACGGGRMAKGGKVDPLLAARTKRDEPSKPRTNPELAKRTDGDAPMKSAGIALRKKGGEVEKDEKQDKREIKTAIHKHDKQMHGGTLTKGLKKGGEAEEREKRAKGGRTKGKGATKINIIIGAPGGGPTPTTPPPQMPVRPPPPPQNAPPPPMMGGPGGPPPGPPPGGPPMPPPGGPPPGLPMRAAGGRIAGYRSKKAGAGSGLGRLKKVHKEGQSTPGFRG